MWCDSSFFSSAFTKKNCFHRRPAHITALNLCLPAGYTTHHTNLNLDEFTSGVLHSAVLEDLEPSSTYFYRVGDAEHGLSDVRNFTTPGALGAEQPIVLGILADLGQTNDSRYILRVKEVFACTYVKSAQHGGPSMAQLLYCSIKVFRRASCRRVPSFVYNREHLFCVSAYVPRRPRMRATRVRYLLTMKLRYFRLWPRCARWEQAVGCRVHDTHAALFGGKPVPWIEYHFPRKSRCPYCWWCAGLRHVQQQQCAEPICLCCFCYRARCQVVPPRRSVHIELGLDSPRFFNPQSFPPPAYHTPGIPWTLSWNTNRPSTLSFTQETCPTQIASRCDYRPL